MTIINFCKLEKVKRVRTRCRTKGETNIIKYNYPQCGSFKVIFPPSSKTIVHVGAPPWPKDNYQHATISKQIFTSEIQ